MKRRLWLVLMAAALFAQPDSEARWKAFLSWLSAQPANSKPSDLLRPYREVLIGEGMSPHEAAREMERLGHLAFTRPDGAKVLWNKVYGGSDPIFVRTPNALLAAAIQDRKPGAALDIGMGQGRNTVFLATQGWDVTGFDPSDEAVRLAQAGAAKAGVKIHTQVASDDQFDFGVARWNLIVMAYVRSLTARDAERIQRALAPGGLFIYENGSDRDNQLVKRFLAFRIVRYEDVDAFPDWNPGEKIRLERLVAEKPRE
jgi:2-polyprenyl-3-methyl-5-hydroxy-6-metoxy-1,4-benzoquinol methylase